MRYISITEAKPDMILASYLYDKTQKPVYQANHILTDSLLDTIDAYQYKGLYIYQCNETIQRIEIDRRFKRDMTLGQAVYLANAIINRNLNDFEIVEHMQRITEYENHYLKHSISVALVSALIGIDMSLTDSQLNELIQAALLHDLGKTLIDKTILNKPSQLTPDEYRQVQTHANLGCQIILFSQSRINSRVMEGIRHHHENHDGSGYPLGLRSAAIPIYARIIHVADVYQALMSDRIYKKAFTQNDAKAYMLDGAGQLFDPTTIHSFIRLVLKYPMDATVIYPATANAG